MHLQSHSSFGRPHHTPSIMTDHLHDIYNYETTTNSYTTLEGRMSVSGWEARSSLMHRLEINLEKCAQVPDLSLVPLDLLPPNGF